VSSDSVAASSDQLEFPFVVDVPTAPLGRSAPVYTSHVCDNGKLISDVARLYLRPGMRIADVTYGRGVFWRDLDLARYDFCPSDIVTRPDRPYDFCRLPYIDDLFDLVVLDPPYMHDPGKVRVEHSYQNAATTKGLRHDDILRLYGKGMSEAFRVLKDGGQLWVKCKDEIESGIQRWSHTEIQLLALHLGFTAHDLFIVTQTAPPVVQHKEQKHARKNHSYLWILKKTLRGREERLAKFHDAIIRAAGGVR